MNAGARDAIDPPKRLPYRPGQPNEAGRARNTPEPRFNVRLAQDEQRAKAFSRDYTPLE
jgi:hypothetical protein